MCPSAAMCPADVSLSRTFNVSHMTGTLAEIGKKTKNKNVILKRIKMWVKSGPPNWGHKI